MSKRQLRDSCQSWEGSVVLKSSCLLELVTPSPFCRGSWCLSKRGLSSCPSYRAKRGGVLGKWLLAENSRSCRLGYHVLCYFLVCNHPLCVPRSPLVPSKLWGSSWIPVCSPGAPRSSQSSLLRRSPRCRAEVDRKPEKATWHSDWSPPSLCFRPSRFLPTSPWSGTFLFTMPRLNCAVPGSIPNCSYSRYLDLCPPPWHSPFLVWSISFWNSCFSFNMAEQKIYVWAWGRGRKP